MRVWVNGMATIGDVARHAGVSTTLVSRYLNGVKGVSPASKEKIENAIRALNYVPDESARMLVRRRGGGTAASAAPVPAQNPRDMLPAAVALLCEDVDFQLVSACYLGAKHAIWSSTEYRDVHILLFCIPTGEERGADEDETLAYIAKIARGVCVIGADDSLYEKLFALSGEIPVISVRAPKDAKTLYRAAPNFREICSELEKDSGERILRLCGYIGQSDSALFDEVLPVSYTLRVSDEPYQEHNPLGRRLQSHLL